jgi:hypothetical protein
MTTDLTDRLAGALDGRADPPMTIDLDAVRRGARRRRSRRRGATAGAGVLVVAAAVSAIGFRDEPAAPAAPADSAVEPPAIGGAAILPVAEFGEPVEVYASRAGAPWGQDLPQIDVWESPTGRLVVRTRLLDGRDPSIAPPTTVPVTTVPVTTAVPSAGDVLDVGTRPGVIEQLADDQWVVYLSDDRFTGDVVVARGMTRAEAEREFSTLVDVDGVLTPPVGYELVEHADAQPSSFPRNWYAQTGFGDAPDLWVSVTSQTEGRGSLELQMTGSPGALRTVDGVDVMQLPTDSDIQTSLSWIDERGFLIGVWSWSRELGDEIVEQVTAIGPAEFEAIADAISDEQTTQALRDTAEVDGVQLSVRGTPDEVVLCIGSGPDEQCARDAAGGLYGTMDALVDGEWIIFGAYDIDPEYPPTVDDFDSLRWTMPDGNDVDVQVVEAPGRFWYIARVPAGVPLITADSRNFTGGFAGPVGRPVVIGSLG